MKTYRISERDPGVLGALRVFVHRRYHAVSALQGVSFSLERGKLLGCIGPNGAGKFTTIKILWGILRPDAGRVEVDGLAPFDDRIKHVARIGWFVGSPNPLGAPAWFGFVAPLAGFVVAALALFAWRFGVRHYTLVGS